MHTTHTTAGRNSPRTRKRAALGEVASASPAETEARDKEIHRRARAVAAEGREAAAEMLRQWAANGRMGQRRKGEGVAV
jgi:flagellar biosynthesis/type III secretory pathway M-ring protein FliF/YscJ